MNPVLINSGTEWDDQLGDETLALLGSSYCEELLDNILRGDEWRARGHLIEMQMARIAQGSAKVEYRIDEEALGVPDFKMCKLAYHAWAFKFADRDGNPNYGCWDDDEFVRDMKRGNPEMVLRIHKNRNRVGWEPPPKLRALPDPEPVVLTDERGNAA